MKKTVIGLVGETGSGKDTVANYLKEKYGVVAIRFADPLSDALKIFVDDILKQDQQWISLMLREHFGNDILAKALRKKVSNSEGMVVVNGMRTWNDYEMIKSFSPSHVIYVTAEQKLRWERVFGRGEKIDDAVSFEKFQEIGKAEAEIHISEIGKKADFTIRNEKDLPALLRSVDEVMEKIIN